MKGEGTLTGGLHKKQNKKKCGAQNTTSRTSAKIALLFSLFFLSLLFFAKLRPPNSSRLTFRKSGLPTTLLTLSSPRTLPLQTWSEGEQKSSTRPSPSPQVSAQRDRDSPPPFYPATSHLAVIRRRKIKLLLREAQRTCSGAAFFAKRSGGTNQATGEGGDCLNTAIWGKRRHYEIRLALISVTSGHSKTAWGPALFQARTDDMFSRLGEPRWRFDFSGESCVRGGPRGRGVSRGRMQEPFPRRHPGGARLEGTGDF